MSSLEQMLKSLDRARLNSEKKTSNNNKLANADPSHELASNTVTKSHALSRAYYRLGLVEKRCMEALISKLHPLRSDNDLQEIELSALEYAKTYSVSEKTAYRDVASAVEALMHRVIRADRPNGKKGKIEMTVMSFAEYKDDEGKITCGFNNRIVPHLIGLREKFSSYPLEKTVNFSSSYTWRFYELLVSWAQPKQHTDGRFMGWIDRQSVDELREMLGVPQSYRWADFQKQVLDVAQSELNQKAHIHLSIERIKTSRKITHLNIKFIEDQQTQLPLEGGETKQTKPA
ncbi:MAG: Initiator RepB protein [uncultured Thiotrichaceae bacterium]|uniref:Initiator RepB protein n=1 Tax=uncultured Thiotrichaceae bacterium TaxID=298394 RepID=A0A6S6TW08_9GAMM|nr:MAG: Initiator RepB protein [uncultured Thiotrichaceae bacterium]